MRLDAIERVPLRWLWRPWLQCGALNLLTGDPGVGKTTILCEIAAALSSGRALPGQEAQPPVNVWLMTAEDGAADTIAWRLHNQGADPTRTWLTDTRESLTSDVVRSVKKEVAEKGIGFLGIDPVQAWMGKDVDMHRANETRDWGSHLRELAMETGCCVVLARHRRKAQPGEKALYSGMGSIDLTGAARSEISAARAKDDTTYIQRIKGNVGLTDAANVGLAFVIEPSEEEGNDHGVLRWLEKGEIDAASVARVPAKLNAAKEFLSAYLKDGPRDINDVLRDGAHQKLTQKTLERAKKELGIVSRQVTKGKWVWEFPQKGCSEADR